MGRFRTLDGWPHKRVETAQNANYFNVCATLANVCNVVYAWVICRYTLVNNGTGATRQVGCATSLGISKLLHGSLFSYCFGFFLFFFGKGLQGRRSFYPHWIGYPHWRR